MITACLPQYTTTMKTTHKTGHSFQRSGGSGVLRANAFIKG
jgi:hypothetical protein